MQAVTPANQERAQVAGLCQQVQKATGQDVKVAFPDQGYTGQDALEQAARHGIELTLVKLPEAKKGFVLLPRGWVVERSFAWMGGFADWPATMKGSVNTWPAITG